MVNLKFEHFRLTVYKMHSQNCSGARPWHGLNMWEGISSGYFYSGDRGSHCVTPGCLNAPPGRRSGVVCDVTMDTVYLCWPETAVRSRGGWRSVWTASWRSRGRRLAFFSLYIDTVMNAKFGEGAYTLSPHSNWDVWSQNLHNSLMNGLCCVFIIVSM